MLLDKNPDQVLVSNLKEITHEFSNHNPNVVLCSEPFLKSQFLNELIDSVSFPIIFLDFDLLYTGYSISTMIPKNKKVEVYQPNKDNLEKIFSEVTKKISGKKYLVILDSFNGFYNLFTGIESGVFINAIVMLLVSVANQNNSKIVISAMARKKEAEGWVLSPGGRQIIKSKHLGMYYVKSDEKMLVLRSLNDNIQKNQNKI